MKTADHFADRLVHGDHRELYAYWAARRGAARAPLRSSLDPTDFPHLLPRMAVIEAVEMPRGRNFRYRLAGTDIVRRTGRDPTGKLFDEVFEGEYLAQAMATYQELAETARPIVSHRVYPVGDGRVVLRYDRLILPVSSNGVAVDQFFLLIVVVDQNAKPKRIGSFQVYSAD